MSNIKAAFENGKAFIAFLTAGDPCLHTTEELVKIMAESGADLIEIGIPFSDPVAEGEVIQRANMRALAAGTTTDKIFNSVENIRKNVNVPIVFLTYINPIFTYGTEKFMQRCKETGINGVIVPDLPFEEKGEISEMCKKYGVELISLIAPTSEKRIGNIAKEAEGFVYCVSSMGVTGVRSKISTDLEAMIKSVKEVKNIPCAIGFGISTPEQAAELAKISDGVIVGSAIVKIIEKHGKESGKYVAQYVTSMKNVLK